MKWIVVGAAVVVGIGVIRFLARLKPPSVYLSAQWRRDQIYDRRGQGGWI